jgi:hypothetical protein
MGETKYGKREHRLEPPHRNSRGVFSILGFIWAYRAERDKKRQAQRFEYMLRVVDRNVDKNISMKEIHRLGVETESRAQYLEQIDQKIKIEVPHVARNTFVLEQLSLARENAMEAYQKWQSLQATVVDLEEAPLLPKEISRAIEEQLQPEYVRRERSRYLQNALGISGSIAVMLSLLRSLLPLELFYALLFALAAFTFITLMRLVVLRAKRGQINHLVRVVAPTVGSIVLISLGAVGLLLGSILFLTNVYPASEFSGRHLETEVIVLASVILIVIPLCMTIIGIYILRKMILKRRRPYELTNRLSSEGKIDEAITLVKSYLIDTPWSHNLKWELVQLLLKKGETQRAAELVVRDLQGGGPSFSFFKKDTPIERIKRTALQIENREQAKQFLECIISLCKEVGITEQRPRFEIELSKIAEFVKDRKEVTIK